MLDNAMHYSHTISGALRSIRCADHHHHHRVSSKRQRCSILFTPLKLREIGKHSTTTHSDSTELGNTKAIHEQNGTEDDNNTTPKKKCCPDPLTTDHLDRNANLVQRLQGQLILAPLTRGGNLPFRRLCADFGAHVTVGEMIFARHLIKKNNSRNMKERALLRRAPNETVYGVQIATNVIDEGVQAGLMAVEEGADFVDLNCGCPIHEATRRGLGSALLRKPEKLARLVNGIATQLPVPLTVKVRTGLTDSDTNVEKVATLLRDAGAAAVTLHGRSAMARYKRPADWSLITRVATTAGVPIIGNGDILTRFEAERRLLDHECLAAMIGRGALVKPWIFEEVTRGQDIMPTAMERIGIYRKLVSYMKEHFGCDDLGQRKSFYFLPWHLGFLSRYRPLPENIFSSMSKERPLISTRWDSVAVPEVGESLKELPLIERLLRCDFDKAHEEMAHVLWESCSDSDAFIGLERLANEHVLVWEEEAKQQGDGREGEGREPEG